MVPRDRLMRFSVGREVVDRNPNYNKVEDVSEGETVSLNCLPGPVPHDVDVSIILRGGCVFRMNRR